MVIGTKGKPWGYFANIAFCYFYICVLFGSLYCVFWIIYNDEKAYRPRMDIFDFFDLIVSKMAVMMVFAQFIFSFVIVVTVPILIYLRKGFSLREYLSLKWVSLSKYILWLGIVILFQFSAIIISHFMKMDSALEEMIVKMMKDLFQPSFSTPYIYFIIIVLAPIFEELLFRGFLYKGFRESKAGKWGAILTTSVIFGVIHIFNAIPIFILGLFLGLAREKTGTVYVPMAMHATNNLIASGLIYYIVHKG
jgi:uncharacterized protein